MRTIVRKCQAVDCCRRFLGMVNFQVTYKMFFLDVPDLNGLILRCRCELSTIRGEGERADRFGVFLESLDERAVESVPERDDIVIFVFASIHPMAGIVCPARAGRPV